MCQHEKTDPPAGPESWQAIERVTAACALAAAIEVGLVSALSGQPRRASELAVVLGLHPERTRYVLDVLAGEGLARCSGDGYTRGELLDALPSGMGGNGRDPLALMARLGSALRGEATGWAMDADPAERAAVYREAAPVLAEMFELPAAELAAQLPATRSILDLGCGSGVWGLAVAQRNAEASVVGVDFEAVLPAMAQRAAVLGIRDRVRLHPADLRVDPLPGGFDTVLLANVLRLEPPAVAREMLLRARGCLAPGGHLVVVDAIANGSDQARYSVALYALHLGLRTSRGHVHDGEHIQGWLRDAGLGAVRRVSVAAQPRHLGVVLARAPG